MDRLVLEKTSNFQKIQLFEEFGTKRLTLALDGYVQFFEGKDERAYHEALIKPIGENLSKIKRVVLLGGGDGLASRELLRLNPDLDIVLVDIDSEVVKLCKNHPRIREINQDSLDKIRVVVCDAKVWILAQDEGSFDVVIADFPDPMTEELKKLYSPYFFKDIKKILRDGGLFVIQAGSNWIKTYFACQSVFWDANVLEYKMPTLGKGQIVWARKNG